MNLQRKCVSSPLRPIVGPSPGKHTFRSGEGQCSSFTGPDLTVTRRLGEISERRAKLGMKVEKRATADLHRCWFLDLGLFSPDSAVLSNATYDQSNGPFVSAFCLCAAVTRNRQIILFEWLFQTSRKASTTIGNLL